jgi:hypothetical protein
VLNKPKTARGGPRHAALLFLPLLFGACAGPSTAVKAQQRSQTDELYTLVVLTSDCWGGDIPTQEKDCQASRTVGKVRCERVVREIYGTDDPVRYLRLDSFEPRTIHDVANKVEGLAMAGQAATRNRDQLVSMMNRFADAKSEQATPRESRGDRVLHGM